MPIQEKLTPELLIAAYSAGFFPMADMRSGRNRAIGWYSPDPRAVIPLAEGGLHVPRSLARTIRRGAFALTVDTCFERVMRECAAPRTGQSRDEHWISEEMIEVYTQLHRLGMAHSVEAWVGCANEQRLVGGLYGVSIGAAFFAESMFSRPEFGGTDASKVCLVELVTRLRCFEFEMLDVQMTNQHTCRFGVVEIQRAAFLEALAEVISKKPRWVMGQAHNSGDASIPGA